MRSVGIGIVIAVILLIAAAVGGVVVWLYRKRMNRALTEEKSTAHTRLPAPADTLSGIYKLVILGLIVWICISMGKLNSLQQDIETLKMYGEVYIVTYQKSYQNKIDTLNWLFDNGITYDGICFVKDKSLIRCDFLIDDNDYNIIRGNAKVGILITAPYNKDMNIIDLEYESGCDRVFRFDSLHDFVQDFVHKEDMKAAFEMGMFGPAGMKSIEERILNDNSWAHY